ncbi:MAG: hypothetical protein ACKOYP_12985, partial [Bacteroidota bacterium]
SPTHPTTRDWLMLPAALIEMCLVLRSPMYFDLSSSPSNNICVLIPMAFVVWFLVAMIYEGISILGVR